MEPALRFLSSKVRGCTSFERCILADFQEMEIWLGSLTCQTRIRTLAASTEATTTSTVTTDPDAIEVRHIGSIHSLLRFRKAFRDFWSCGSMARGLKLREVLPWICSGRNPAKTRHLIHRTHRAFGTPSEAEYNRRLPGRGRPDVVSHSARCIRTAALMIPGNDARRAAPS
jgi:hypothetical protein